MTTSQQIKTTCTRCGGDGLYHAPTSLPGGCFACAGRGYFVTSAARIARQEAQERKAIATAQDAAAVSQVVIDALLAAWGDEFAHIDAEYRHHHATQKAQRVAHQRGIKVSFYVGDLLPHLDAILAA